MTVEILNLDTSTVSVTDSKPADKANFKLVDTVQKAEGRESVYQKVSGDEEFPMTVRIGWYPSPKALDGIGQTNISIKVSTFVKKTNGGGDLVWVKPCSFTIASQMPGTSGVPDSDDFIVLALNALSWMLPLDSGVFVASAIDEYKYGVVNQADQHIDD